MGVADVIFDAAEISSLSRLAHRFLSFRVKKNELRKALLIGFLGALLIGVNETTFDDEKGIRMTKIEW